MSAQLEAGRELDALVDATVFGRSWPDDRCRVCGWPFRADGGCMSDNCSMRPAPARRADEPAHYSRDIAAAWPLFQHCSSWVFSRRKRFFAALQSQASLPDGTIVAWPDVLVVLRDRFPLAVCRAALAARVGAEP